MAKHVMLSYQWNKQELVKEVYTGLRDMFGINTWMDIEGGVKGNINERWGDSSYSGSSDFPEEILRIRIAGGRNVTCGHHFGTFRCNAPCISALVE